MVLVCGSVAAGTQRMHDGFLPIQLRFSNRSFYKTSIEDEQTLSERQLNADKELQDCSVWSHFFQKLLQTKETDKWFKPKKQTDKSKNPILCSLPSLFVGLF